MNNQTKAIAFGIFVLCGAFLSFRFFNDVKMTEEKKEMTENGQTHLPEEEKKEAPEKQAAHQDSNLDQLRKLAAEFQKNRDQPTLKAFSDLLVIGMNRVDIESMLGEADYSPLDGQYYYVAKKSSENETVTIGLVVTFNDSDGKLTDKLQAIHYGEIGE